MGTTSTAVLDSPTPIHQLRKAPHGNAQIELVGYIDRAFILMACPQHEWKWPLSNPDAVKLNGFDAHQSCMKCASQRLFNTTDWTPGPMFRYRSRVQRHS